MGEAFAGRQLGKKGHDLGCGCPKYPRYRFYRFILDGHVLQSAGTPGLYAFISFCLLITPVFGMLAERWHRPHNIRLRHWIAFFGAVIFIHILIDAFNNYGVGWFEPFSHRRISFNAIYVADPFFSIWPAIGCFMLIYLDRYSTRRKDGGVLASA